MNAHAEREKSTRKEEYIDYHEDELLDPEQFTLLKADRGTDATPPLAQHRATPLVS